MSSETPGVVNQIEYRWDSNGDGLRPVAWSYRQQAELYDWRDRISPLVRAPERPRNEAARASVVYAATGLGDDVALLLRRRSPQLADLRAGDDRSSLITKVLTGPLELLTPAVARGLVRWGSSALRDPEPGLAAHGTRLSQLRRADLEQIERFSQPSTQIRTGQARLRWCQALVAAALTQVNSRLWVVLPPAGEYGQERREWAEQMLVDALAVADPVLAGLRIDGQPEGWGCSFSTYQELRADRDVQQFPRIVLCDDDPEGGAPISARKGQWLSMWDSDTGDLAGHDREQLTHALVEAFDEWGETDYRKVVTEHVGLAEDLQTRLAQLSRAFYVPSQQGRGADAPAEHGYLTTANGHAQGSAGSAAGEGAAARRPAQTFADDRTLAEGQGVLVGQTGETTTARTSTQTAGPRSGSAGQTSTETHRGGPATGSGRQIRAADPSPRPAPSAHEERANAAVHYITDRINRPGALEPEDQEDCFAYLRDYAGAYVTYLSECPRDLPDQLGKTVKKIVLPALGTNQASAADVIEWLSRPTTPADLVRAVHDSGALNSAEADLRDKLLPRLGMRWLREHTIHPDPTLWPWPSAHPAHRAPQPRPWWRHALTPFTRTAPAICANSLYWVCWLLLLATLCLAVKSCGAESTAGGPDPIVNPTQPHTSQRTSAPGTTQTSSAVQPGRQTNQDVPASVPQQSSQVPARGGQDVSPARQQPSTAVVSR